MLFSLSHTRRFVSRLFAIDKRSLAVFRIFLGMLLIIDILLRSRNFWFYYTNKGVTPYSVVTQINIWGTASLPIWEYTSHYAVVAFVFLVALSAGITITVGYKTRLSVFIGFLAVSAIDARNPFVLSYADFYYHLLFFWSVFLPLGATWSIDAIQSQLYSDQTVINSIDTTEPYFGFGSVCILLQVLIMYTVNGLHKFVPAGIHGPRKILYNIIHYDHVTYGYTAPLFGEFQTILYILSYMWAVMIATSVLLLIIRHWSQTILLCAFIGSHLFMAFTVRIGAFPFVSIMGLCLFIRSSTWERVLTDVPDKTETAFADTVIMIRSYITRVSHLLIRVEPSYSTQKRMKSHCSRALTVLYVSLVVLSLLLTVGNIAGVSPVKTTTADHVSQTITVFGVDQPSWNFFTSDDIFVDRWYVFNSTTAGGETIDVFNDRSASSSRPYTGSNLQKQYSRTYRDRFYLNRVSKYPSLTKSYATYLCGEYSDSTSKKITSITMYQYRQPFNTTTASNRSSRNQFRFNIGRYSCDKLTA